MRKVLIIHAHPEPKSFNSALKDKAAESFTQAGHEVKVCDLYAENFNPVGDRHDFTALSNPDYFKYQAEQVNAFQNDLFEAGLKAEMDKLLWCDTLVFNFPLWWFGLPAILKGWVDRLFAMGLVYGAGKGVYENGFFKGKEAFLCFTTGGPEVAYGENGKNGQLDTILFPIQHGMLYFCGFTVLEPFVCFAPVRLDDEQRAAELERYGDYLRNLDRQKRVYG